MSMKQIETLVFDYGGVIVNIDDASVVKAMESLGVTAFKRLIHVRKIKRLMHQYINGLVYDVFVPQEVRDGVAGQLLLHRHLDLHVPPVVVGEDLPLVGGVKGEVPVS